MFKKNYRSKYIPKRRLTNKFTPKYKHHFRARAKVRQRTISKATNSFRVFFTAGILSFGLVFCSYKIYNFLFLNPKFKIRNITVTGLKSIPREKFYSLLPAKPGENLFKTYFLRMEKTVTYGLPVIKSFSVSRDIPDTIRFAVTERKPLAWLTKNRQTNYIDEENVCFTVETASYAYHVPYIEVESAETSQQAVQLLSYLKEKDSQLYFNILKLYNIRDRVTIVLNDNSKIFWGFPDSEEFEPKLDYFNKTMAAERERTNNGGIEYIDLKLFREGRIIVKPAAKAAALETAKTGVKPVKQKNKKLPREARWQEKN